MTETVFPADFDEFTLPVDPGEGQYVWQDGTIRDGVGEDAQIIVEANPALIHENQHALTFTALAALQQKVGVDGSEDEDSLDYQIAQKQDLIPGMLPLGLPNAVPTVNATGDGINYIYGINQSLQTVDNVVFDSVKASNLTQGRVPIIGAAGLIMDTLSLAWDNALKYLLMRSTTGSNLVTNGSFTGNATGWTLPTGWAYSANTIVHSSNGTGAATPSTPLTTVVAGQLYDYSVTISSWTVGTVTLSVGGVTQTAFGANGVFSGSFVATATGTLTLTPTNTARLAVDDVSVTRASGGKILVGEVISNLFTAIQSSLGTTTADGAVLDNPTNATNSATQVSPAMKWRGRAWNTSTSQSKTVDFRAWVQPYSSTTPSGIFRLQQSTDGAAFADLLSVDSLNGGAGVKVTAPAAQSNAQPGTTRMMTFENSGGNTYIDFLFSGVRKAHIGVKSSGEVQFYGGGDNYVGFYSSAGSLYCYNYPTAIVHYGYGGFNRGVVAGGSFSPTSTLQVHGSTSIRSVHVNSNVTMGDYSVYYFDATGSTVCSGTPTYACTHWTTEYDCGLRSSHGDCVWTPPTSCSVFDYEYGMSNCIDVSPCSPATDACSGSDQSSCEADDDSYGGPSPCAWDAGSNTCPSYTNATDCDSHSPCYSNNSGDCGTLSDGGGDGSSCATQPQCSYDSGTGVCSGYYFTSCDGDNTTPTCNGTKYTGICDNSYGGSCGGSSNCAGIDVADCTSESGCSTSTGIIATLPDGDAVPGRKYYVYNETSGGGSVKFRPHPSSGQTVDFGSEYESTDESDNFIWHYSKRTRDCAIYTSAGACTPTGCSSYYNNCSWDSMESTCSGDASCSGIIDQTTCESTSYFSSCDGTEVVSKNWYRFNGVP